MVDPFYLIRILMLKNNIQLNHKDVVKTVLEIFNIYGTILRLSIKHLTVYLNLYWNCTSMKQMHKSEQSVKDVFF